MDKMKLILADMHVADAVAQTKGQGGVNEKQLSREYYARIYKNHEVTEKDFTDSYHFYERNPELMNKLYEDVLTEMSAVEASQGKTDSTAKRDSIITPKKP